MLYRDNRGSLEESLATQIELTSTKEIINHLNSHDIGEVAEIKFQYNGFDSRTSWNTYLVLQRFINQLEFYVAGMCNGLPKQ